MFIALELITRAGRTPHGYTLTVWAAGMFCVSRHGLPTMAEVWSFTLAATVSFGVVRFVVTRRRDVSVVQAAHVRGFVASMHLLALPGAMAVSSATALVIRPWCWPLSSAAATCVFLILHGGQDAFTRRRRSRVLSATAEKLRQQA